MALIPFSTRALRTLGLPLLLMAIGLAPAPAAETGTPDDYLAFIRSQAAVLHAADKPPATPDEWAKQRKAVRIHLSDAWGGFPSDPCPLLPRKRGEIVREGYRVEKVVFQTRPGVWMTANAYVPEGAGRRPAVLAVHGHWRGAKQDPVVQARCIGLAKLGFFVLAVDAFGAGERAIGKALGEYHGAMTGATLLPIGLPLSGLQVYENMRAVDYLRTRPEVVGDRIGVTGASGGGNQTMYAAAWDERLKAAVPVCSVGNYQAYLGVACCMCELVPSALRFTEEWGVLGLTAPRGLMIVNATRDASQFSVDAAKKSLAFLEPLYGLLGQPAHVRHAIFESGHDYSRPMREAMYGWMTLHLKREGDGAPIAEPAITTEDPETLRCYPGDSRPDDWVTIPRFARDEAKRLLAKRSAPGNAEEWRGMRASRQKALVDTVFGGFPQVSPTAPRVEPVDDGRKLIHFAPEPGIALTASVEPGKTATAPLTVLLNLDGRKTASSGKLADAFRREGWGLVTLDLRATGALAWPHDAIGDVPDHNTGQWALWIGRPLLGQWTFDVRRLLDALEQAEGRSPSNLCVIGEGPAGLVALFAGAVDARVSKVATVGTLASYVTDAPYVGQRLGVMAPGIVNTIGDVAHIAALAAPRRVIIAGGVSGVGKPLTMEQLRDAFRDASAVWNQLDAGNALSILESTDATEIVKALR